MIIRPSFASAGPRIGPALALAVVTLAAFALLVNTQTASAQGGRTISSGVVVGVLTDDQGRLEKFAVSDSGGTVIEYSVEGSTEYGLETQAGERWVATQADEPIEVVGRLRDHQERFASITVTSQNGVALSVVERESGKLETNLSYLFAVFAVTWAGFFAYIFFVSRKQRELQREVARLRASMRTNTDE